MPLSEPAPTSPDASPPLAVPFGVIGLVGGWLTGDAFELSDDAIRCLLVSVTPIVAALLGGYLTPRLGGAAPGVTGAAGAPWMRHGKVAAGLFVTAAILIAGALNGGLIGLLLAPPVGMLIGLCIGAICALPFIPALAVVLLAAVRVGRARAGSLVAASDRRAVWGATTAVVAVAALFARARWTSLVAPRLPDVIAGAACAVLAALLVADAVALVRVVKAAARAVDAGERGVEALARGGIPTVDFGVGDELRVEVVGAKHAYRGVEQIARVVQGSRDAAVGALGWRLARRGAALAIAAALWNALGG